MMLKIGHRGACGHEPENTLRSFRKAIELGVDMIELDVYVCRTGELVVMHDDKVDRTTDGKGFVINKTFDELRSLDAGKGERIPTLKEVLDLVDRKVKVNIELKGEKTAGPVIGLIAKYVKEKHWKKGQFLLSSFSRSELVDARGLDADVLLGYVTKKIEQDLLEFAESISAYSINIRGDMIDKGVVDRIHKAGRKVFAWVINNKADAEKLKNIGVDGIFSDFPDRV